MYYPSSFKDAKEYQLLDFNADGKTDLLLEKTDRIEIYSLTKHARYVNKSSIKLIYTNTNYNHLDDFKVGDFNGDGNSDLLVKKYNSSWRILISTGNSFYHRTTNTPSLQYNSSSKYRISVADVNQDGKSDILYIKDASPNYGQGAWSPDYQLNVLVSNGESFVLKETVEDLDIEYTTGTQRNILRGIGNFKGNGDNEILLDNNFFSTIKPATFSCNEGVDFNKITGITNSLGNELSIEYDYSNIDGVDRIIRIDFEEGSHIISQKSIGFKAVKSITGTELLSEYAFGQMIINKGGRGFIGFDKSVILDKIQNTGILMINEFNSSFKIANLKKQITFVNNGAFSTADDVLNGTINTSSYISESIYRNHVAVNYSNGTNESFNNHVDQIIQKNYLNNTSTKEEWSFDNYYNKTNSYKEFYNDINGSNAEVMVTTTIPVFLTRGAWCPSKPESINVLRSQNGGNQSRTISYLYDTKGNVTKETKDSGDKNQVVNDFKNYNDFGNPKLIETTANGITRSTTINYYNSGRFIQEKVDNYTSFSTSYNYDEIQGTLTSQTNHLGLVTEYKYDGFRRKEKSIYADGTFTISALQWAAGNGPTGAVYYAYGETSGQSPVWKWYDVLGRELRTESYGFDCGRKICIDTDYNTKGQVETISKPYFTGDGKVAEITCLYDDYGRVESQTTPMGITSTTYGNLTTTVISPNGTHESTMNGAGQIVTSKVNGRTVSYTYWPSGLTKTSTPQDGQAVETFFDLQGNREKLIDPDAGIIESETNGFGEVLWEEHKKTKPDNSIETIHTAYNYDNIGRIDFVTRNGVVTDYQYNPTTGFLEWTKKPNHEVYFTYDENGIVNLGRITTTTEKIGSTQTFAFKSEYDEFGREKKQIYPSGFFVTNTFNKYGFLTDVKNKNGTLIWKAEEANVRGQLTKVKKGSTLTTYGFDTRHLPESIIANGIIDHHYIFNTKGNLESREDLISHHKEIFSYNSTNNQLEGWEIKKNGASVSNFSMGYDDHGNITGKSDIGYEMRYDDAQRLHAITSISGNPSLISDSEQIITYTDFKKVHTISEGNDSLILSYGIDYQRRKGVFYRDGAITTRYYLGNYEEDHTSTGIKKIHYISGGNGLAAIYVEDSNGGQLYYAYTDYLGSLIALADENSNVVENHAFDPWGNRRDPNNWASADTRISWMTDRGFTMHEHLDGFALINMNGRVYDPQIARFLSPDPQLQAPGNWLNYNRYAYCLNNPLIYTDPDGEFIVPAIIIGAFINAAIQGATGNLNSQGDFFLSLGIGALSGAAGFGAGQLVAGTLSTATTLGGAALSGAATGAASGFAGGFVGGAGSAWAGGASFGQGLQAGLIGGGYGALGGAIIGGGAGGINHLHAKNHFLAIDRNSSIKTNPDKSLTPSKQTLCDFSDEYFANYKFRDNANLIYKKGYVELINPKYGAFTDGSGMVNGKYNIFFAEKSFASKWNLFLNMGHEYVHVANLVTLGSNFTTKYSEYAAYKWNHRLSGDKYFLNKANLNYNPDILRTAYKFNMIKINYMKYFDYGLPMSIPSSIY